MHNIGALLYHPTNQNRTNQVMAAAERRKQEQQNQMRSQHPGPHPGLPSIGHHPMLPSSTPTQQPQPMGPHPMQRPAVDRTQTFPTPPASASSLVDGSGISQSNYQWQQAAQAAPPMSIDTGLSNARSMPTTPATTPPGTTIQSMPQYPAATQSYDGSRQQMYSAPATQQSPYQSTNGAATHDSRSIYAQHGTYVKSEMGPPTAPAGRPVEQQDTKPNGMMHPGHTGGEQHHAGGEEHDEHEHEAEYTHDSTAYDANRGQYNYSAPGGVGSMQGDHAHLSPELTGSPSHQAGSGRATPRTQPAPQPYYGQQPGAGYSTPPRHQQAPGSLYNVVSGGDARGPTNGATGSADVYGTQQDMGSMHHQQNGGYVAPTPQHQQTQPLLNGGSSGGIKRSRDDDEELARPSSGGGIDLKRRKTGGMMDDMNRPGSAIAAAQQRRR